MRDDDQYRSTYGILEKQLDLLPDIIQPILHFRVDLDVC
jgi:hypothetical protein